MPGKRGKIAAVGSAAVVAVGGGAAALDRLGHGAAEEASHVHIDVPRTPDVPGPDRPTPGSDIPTPVPGSGSGSHAAGSLVAEGESDDEAKDIICFAYQQYGGSSDGGVTMPSETDFGNAVAEGLAPPGSALAYRAKAHSLYQSLSDPNADWSDAAASLAC